jgi:hypothetical protein
VTNEERAKELERRIRAGDVDAVAEALDLMAQHLVRLVEKPKIKRPIVFALECVLAMAIALAGAWLAAKAGHKLNAKANGDIRAAAAQERIASAMEAIAAAQTYRHYDQIQPAPEKRRKLTAREDEHLSHHIADCDSVAFIGYDNNLHPDYCRP